ncbi:MAG: hypothetical protein ACP5DX_03115 [Paracoccaceae bacterium]
MTGIRIFIHSVRIVFGNFGAALRISGLLYLVQVAAAQALGVLPTAGLPQGEGVVPEGGHLWGRFAMTAVVWVVASLWIAVAWHRYVLREETPGSLLPAFHGGRMLGYLMWSFLITVVAALAGAVLADVAFGLLWRVPVQGSFPMVSLLPLVIAVPLLAVTFRLLTVLPAAALGEAFGLGDGWRKTAGHVRTFLVLAVLTILIQGIINWVTGGVGFATPVSLTIYYVSEWVKLMVGISILTTLYGHFVENRALG